MESSINTRMSELIKALRMSTNAFAKSLGKSQSALALIVDGKSKPGFEMIELICDTYKVNPSWLIRGDGEMFSNAQAEPRADQYLQDQVKQIQESFNRLANQLEVKDKQIESKDRQIDRLMDMLGKLDLSEDTPWYVLNSLAVEKSA